MVDPLILEFLPLPSLSSEALAKEEGERAGVMVSP